MHTLAIGEILWDIIEGKAHLGGAPFNVAAHLARMGADSYFISAVGEDELGERALKNADDIGVNTEFINVLDNKPTGTVDVFLKDGHPDYTINEEVAWDYLQLTRNQEIELKSLYFDFLIFGSLAQRGRHNQAFFRDLIPQLNVEDIFVDINLRKDGYTKETLEASFEWATILKLSDEEVETVSQLFYGETLEPEIFALRLSDDFYISIICITLGPDGAAVYKKGKMQYIPGIKVRVEDTIGAGDSFSAAFLYTYHQTGDLLQSAKRGCQLGAFVASNRGAVPEYTGEVRKWFK